MIVFKRRTPNCRNMEAVVANCFKRCTYEPNCELSHRTKNVRESLSINKLYTRVPLANNTKKSEYNVAANKSCGFCFPIFIPDVHNKQIYHPVVCSEAGQGFEFAVGATRVFHFENRPNYVIGKQTNLL